MKKIKLTEQDLIRLIKKVMSESESVESNSGFGFK
jgi:hypothetical protein